jgi:hypothetical protein
VAKANYHQIRRQKELARKSRQQEKQQKRQTTKDSAADPDGTVAVEEPVAGPSESSSGSESV